MVDFVSLHNHTSMSIMDSVISKPIDLFNRAKELGQSAIAITEHGSCVSLWDALKASKKTGVKLIAGCEMYFVDDVNNHNDNRLRHIILLAKNAEGYKNLLSLNKKGYDNYTVAFKKAVPRIDWNLLEEYKEGLICTTACGNGIISQLIMADKLDAAKQQASKLRDIFGDDLALELQPNHLQRKANPYSGPVDQRKINLALKKIGEELNIRCIVSCNTHYLSPKHHKANEVLLAIGCGQPVTSGQRMSYDKPDMYLKSADEVLQYFERHRPMWGDQFIDNLFANTVYLSSKCEEPDWIDPKYSNPTGKELPQFPVKDQPDYQEFLAWEKTKNTGLAEDVMYLRYRCEAELDRRFKKGELISGTFDDYQKRVEEELEVLEYHGFSSYMLIVGDFLDWGRRNGIPTGPGRGCLDGGSLIYTADGLMPINKIRTGQYIYTHSGEKHKVISAFKYDVSESGIRLYTNFSYNPVLMTNDHEVFAVKSKETERYIKTKKKGSTRRWQQPGSPEWIKASDLKVNDLIFTPFVSRDVKPCPNSIDLSCGEEMLGYEYLPDKIIKTIPLDNDRSKRAVARKSGVNRSVLNRVLRGKPHRIETVEKIERGLDGMSFEEWSKISNVKKITYNRNINCNEDFYYFLGRWVGDGWIVLTKSISYVIGMAFNKDDEKGIARIKTYLESIGFVVARRDSENKKLVQLIIHDKLLFRFLERLFPDYSQTSGSKHLPIGFRNLSDSLLKALIRGLIGSDGNIEIGKKGLIRENIDTTSERLLKEVREALLYLKIPCGTKAREPFKRGKYLCSKSYKIRFKGIETKKSSRYQPENGYFSKIVKIEKCELDSVYDIETENDHSYLTSEYAVHNSCGGCFVAYLLGIHIGDPLKYKFIFARFHNKEKTNYPDLDTDIAPSGIDKIHAYIQKKYGDEYVAHVSNVNTITPKVYARDISRTFEFGDEGRSGAAKIGDAIADSIPAEMKTVKQALDQAPLFGEYAKQYPQLSEYAELIGGHARDMSTHAAGIVINKRKLTGLVPLRRDVDGQLSLEYEKEKAEENGLIKIDTLRVETLDIIATTKRIIKEIGQPLPPDPFDYDAYDEKTYQLIADGNTFCVFQLGGTATQLCKTIKPKCIEDISLISALLRPSAKDIVNDLVSVREGKKPIQLIHPSLERAFASTYGFGLYEECLIYCAQDVAGWDLHKSDSLRKMTKQKGKYPEKTEELRKAFIADAQKNKGIEEEIATKIWTDVISVFEGYGFNISHSTLYSLISYETAFLKAHYPIPFLVANLLSKVKSNAKQAKENILRIKDEIRALGVKIVPPDINTSGLSYKIIDDKTLMTGLDSLKYMGSDAIPEIIGKRPFKTFSELISRVDASKVRAPSIQAMAASGSLDAFGLDRKLMFLYASDYRNKLRVHMNKKQRAFDKINKIQPTIKQINQWIDEFVYPWPANVKPWTTRERYALEEFYMGEGISGTVKERYEGFFDEFAINFNKLREIMPYEHQSEDERENRRANTHNIQMQKIRGLKGIITTLFSFRVKKEDSKIFGQEMARIVVQDPWGNDLSVIAFPEAWEGMQQRIERELGRGKQKVEPGIAIYFSGSFQWENAHTNSFILGDILDYRPIPALPADLKSRKVKMPRGSKLSKKEIDELEKEDLVEQLEEEMVDEGVSPIFDDDETEEDL